MSVIQRALDRADKKRRADAGAGSPPAAANTAASSGSASLSAVFHSLISAGIHSGVMERNKILPAIDDRKAVSAYKVLRTRVLHSMRAHRWQTLIVTSAGPGEGKTLTSCNLALSIANDVNQSVILVDLDLQRSTLASYFGLEVDKGIGDYLTGRAEIEDIVYSPKGLDRILIIPNRETIANSSDLLASPRMRTLLDWVKSPSRGAGTAAVFDMPPVLVCDDVLAFSTHVDAVLLVVAEEITDRTALGRTAELLADCNLLGVVLNRSLEASGPSDYYYY